MESPPQRELTEHLIRVKENEVECSRIRRNIVAALMQTDASFPMFVVLSGTYRRVLVLHWLLGNRARTSVAA